MKQKLMIVVVAVFALSFFSSKSDVKAQVKENVVTLSISNLIVATPTLYYERALSDKNSAKLGLFYTTYKAGDTKYSGLGIMPEYRIYPGSKDAPSGFYFAPFLKYQNFSLKSDYTDLGVPYEAKASLSGIGGGLIVGNQWLFGDVVALDLFIGPSLASWSVNYKDNANEEYFDFAIFNTSGLGVGVRFGISLGFGF